MRFALITDVHFGPRAYHEGKLRKMSERAPELTARFVERMNAQERPELVFNLGDVIEDESRALDLKRYREFAQILAGVSGRVQHVPGNHDQVYLTREDLLSIWGHDAERVAKGELSNCSELYYSFDFGGLHFLVLRTDEYKDHHIELPEVQMEFAERDLGATRLPTLVLMHHPASEQRLSGNRWFEKAPHVCRVRERGRLRRIFESSGRVVAVFNGHVHWNHLDVIAGIPYITLQSLTENLDEDAPGRPASAYAVCDIDARSLHVDIRGEEPLRFQLELPR
ncbi:MAG TPA: metallophosphoesterase [Polyangiaceae bacterium]|nr:metallophosphoesterase [Polyangiaceae bacterium]